MNYVITFLIRRWKSISLKEEMNKKEEDKEKTSSVFHITKILKNLDSKFKISITQERQLAFF